MTFTLTIDLDNAAFEEDVDELSRILKSVADTLATNGLTSKTGFLLRDVNGNTVGKWKVTDSA